ncbi:MAG: hypothetical protein ACKOAL_05360, partial [Chthoniobacterales bacterium]
MKSETQRQRQAMILRLVLVVLVGVPLLVGIGFAGYYFFAGWRARDLAAKAKVNLEDGNLRMAWLQISSAKDLRAEDPEVWRTAALSDARFGR